MREIKIQSLERQKIWNFERKKMNKIGYFEKINSILRKNNQNFEENVQGNGKFWVIRILNGLIFHGNCL